MTCVLPAVGGAEKKSMQFFYIIKIVLEKRRNKPFLRMRIILKMEMD